MQIDLQMESGEYFMREEQRALKKSESTKEKQKESQARQKIARAQDFIPPVEAKFSKIKNPTDKSTNVEEIVKKLKKAKGQKQIK